MIIVTSGDRDSLNVLLELAGTSVRVQLGPAPMDYCIWYDGDKDSFDWGSSTPWRSVETTVPSSLWLHTIGTNGELPNEMERISVSKDGGQTWDTTRYVPSRSYENLLIRPVESQWQPTIGQRVLYKGQKEHIVVGKYEDLFYIKLICGTNAKGVKLNELSPALTPAQKIAKQVNPDLTDLADILDDLQQRGLLEFTNE